MLVCTLQNKIDKNVVQPLGQFIPNNIMVSKINIVQITYETSLLLFWVRLVCYEKNIK